MNNRLALRRILKRGAISDFGRRHDFAHLLQGPNWLGNYRQDVPLSSYADYAAYIDRICRGEPNVLTTDPVRLLARSAGTTDQPKRIPRTRRAQWQHLWLVVLAEQAVIDRGIAGAGAPCRGINLMSLYAPPPEAGSAVPVMSGPNAGMDRLRRHIPWLWTSPVPAFTVEDPAAAQYLHALFGLRERSALYVETPFAPQLVGWFDLMRRCGKELVADLREGSLMPGLRLSQAERQALGPHLAADPRRAGEVAAAFGQGFAGIARRLWPRLAYLRTVTSGSFALSLPRLRWFAGPDLPIHSGCHSSTEGIVGINLRTDGSCHYVLAIGTAFFEFIPAAALDRPQPATVDLDDLVTGEDYEVVLTSCAGLYRYRLGDVVRITGRCGSAPTFEFRYRRGTVLDLVGEKTTEFHTARALAATVAERLGPVDALREYAVAGHLGEGVGQYVFYVELAEQAAPAAQALARAADVLDRALCDANESYWRNGRALDRLHAPQIRVVRAGTFEALGWLRLAESGGVSATQGKVPRRVTSPALLAFLDGQTVAASAGRLGSPGPRPERVPEGS